MMHAHRLSNFYTGAPSMPDLLLHLRPDLPLALEQPWDALLAQADAPTPFMSSRYLQALLHSGAARPDTGWTPQFACLMDGERLVAACPLWIKAHSWGEFVFDQAWAQAYARHGLRYYPKGLVAVPFTPVSGSRLLAEDDASRALLAQALMQACAELGLSGLHLLFGSHADAQALQGLGWATREQPQFHWQRAPHWTSFEDFLADLKRDKRKNILQERRHVRDAGVSQRVQVGAEIKADDWTFFERCYANTYAAGLLQPGLARGQRLGAVDGRAGRPARGRQPAGLGPCRAGGLRPALGLGGGHSFPALRALLLRAHCLVHGPRCAAL
jgi:uncharacterized protein